MKKFTLALLTVAAVFPLAGAVQTWTDVPLIDHNCSSKFTAATVDAHTRACALKCESSGYGILTSDGNFLKFDEAGSQKAFDDLKASKKKDHLRATVTGDLEGSTVKVQSIKLD